MIRTIFLAVAGLLAALFIAFRFVSFTPAGSAATDSSATGATAHSEAPLTTEPVSAAPVRDAIPVPDSLTTKDTTVPPLTGVTQGEPSPDAVPAAPTASPPPAAAAPSQEADIEGNRNKVGMSNRGQKGGQRVTIKGDGNAVNMEQKR